MRSLAQPRALEHLTVRLGGLQATTPRRWGTMSAGEMLCHLSDASASVLAPSRGAVQPGHWLVKWIALYAPIAWPHRVKTPAHVDPKRRGTRPGDFEHDRQRALDGLRALAQAPSSAFPTSHGHFGPMSHWDWVRWAYRHTDHHLRQFGL